MAQDAGRHHACMLLMVASGFAGLGYQVVWTQQCALWLGHESAAVLAVIAAFFGGMALGAMLLGARIERSACPARWYAASEALIGAWALLVLVLMPPFSDAVMAWTGPQPSPIRQWAWAFGGTLVLLLPATVAMGATLPAIERVMAHHALPSFMQSGRRSIAAYYACNTLGAVLGVLITAFWLVPDMGLSRTVAVCAGLNALCAVMAWRALPERVAVPADPLPGDASGIPGEMGGRSHRLLWQLALTGCLGIGYEVLVVRVLSQVAEDTVYTFAMLLAVYLVGTALGAAAYQRWGRGIGDQARLANRLLAALAMACLAGTCVLWGSEGLRTLLREALGASMAAAVSAEAGMAMAAFALPTLCMGALFSHLSACASAEGIGFGKALGVNTLGAAVAPWVFGVLLAPWVGPKWSLLVLPLAYVALMLLTPSMEADARSPSRSIKRVSALLRMPAVLALLIGWLAPPLAFVTVPPDGKVLSYSDGVMAAVSVVADAQGVARLRINNRQQEGSSATLLVDGRQALLPMLLHPSPRRALFLGLGTGVTSGTAAEDPSLSVDTVELLLEVIDASRHFASVFDRDAPNERLHIMAGDARRYVRASSEVYDLIVSDNFQPARSGSGALYTVEHFRAVKGRLAPDGLFCQWLPLHQLDIATLRSIVQSFMQAYPQGMAILASNSLETPVIGLVGRRDDGLFDLVGLRERLAHNSMPRSPQAFGINDEFALLGSVLAGPASLKRFAQGTPANTDDLPVVAYMAPRLTYAPDSLPADRLLALLREWSASPREVFAVPVGGEAWAARLSAYWAARNRFIEAGRQVQPTRDVRAMLAQVKAPLLGVLRTSADFRPAYEPLVEMAVVLAQESPLEARALLNELVALQPTWPEARMALQQLP